MSSTPFVIGSSIEDYQNADPHYLYALRKTDEGDLYLLRLDIFDSNDEAKLFGQDIPSRECCIAHGNWSDRRKQHLTT